MDSRECPVRWRALFADTLDQFSNQGTHLQGKKAEALLILEQTIGILIINIGANHLQFLREGRTFYIGPKMIHARCVSSAFELPCLSQIPYQRLGENELMYHRQFGH